MNILKGEKVNTSFKDAILLAKFLITTVLLISAYVANYTINQTQDLDFQQTFLIKNFSNYKRLQYSGFPNVTAEQIISMINDNVAFIDLGDVGINSDELEYNGTSIALFEDNYKRYNDIILHVDSSFINYLNIVNEDINDSSIILTKDIHLSSNIDPYYTDFDIIYIDNQDIPDFTGYYRNKSSTLNSFVLIYDSSLSGYANIQDILFDSTQLSNNDFDRIMENISTSLSIENRFSLVNIESNVESLYEMNRQQSDSDIFNMTILIASFIVLTLLINYLIFCEDLKLLALKKMQGYRNINIYSNIYITNLIIVLCATFFFCFTFNFWHSFGPINWLQISTHEIIPYFITTTLLLLVLDMTITLLYSKILNKNLITTLKRKEF